MDDAAVDDAAEAVTRETWLEGGWTRAVTVVGAVMVVWSGEVVLALIGRKDFSQVDLIAGLCALIASLVLLSAVSHRKISRAGWSYIGFAYMALLVTAAAVGRHDGAEFTRGWPGGAVLVLLYPVMFPARIRVALAFGLVCFGLDLGVAAIMGAFPEDVGGLIAGYHGFVMSTVFAVALAYLSQRVGQVEIVSSKLGAYQLVEKLGEGGMGEVWRADHRHLSRGAAVKLIHPKKARDSRSAAYRKRFELEAQAVARLDSPYTVDIFDYGVREDGVLWFAMELLDGVDMVDFVFENRPLPIERVVHLLRQICFSLQEAHQHGLVHRDIKPNNVMVCRMGAEYDFVKVLDFGLVKTTGGSDKSDAKLTRQGATPGTPGFMAPEQILSPEDVDARADIYGVGCLAYFLVTARLVFEADDWNEVKQAHVKNPVVRPSERVNEDIPAELDEVIMVCLEKDPAERYQSIAELLSGLAAVPTVNPWTRDRARDAWVGHQFRDSDWSLSD